jgi:hypothetical protein
MGVAMADDLLEPVLKLAIFPALVILPPSMASPQAWHQMLAAGLQESGLCARCQVLPGGGRGPAHGLWQNELGGVRAVMGNALTRDHAATLCAARSVAVDAQAVWQAMESDDVLAAGFARLLLWADSKPLPEDHEQDAGWVLYLDAWRPGKPRPQDWPANWARARAFVYGG